MSMIHTAIQMNCMVSLASCFLNIATIILTLLLCRERTKQQELEWALTNCIYICMKESAKETLKEKLTISIKVDRI